MVSRISGSRVTDADDELAHRLVFLHGGVCLLDLLQLINLVDRHRESSGGDRVEVALKHGLRQVAGVAAVAGALGGVKLIHFGGVKLIHPEVH